MTVTRQSIVHIASPGRMRGRITANIATVTRGTAPLSQTQSGLLAGAFGATPALLIASGVIGVAMVAIAKLYPSYWGLRRTDLERADELRRAAGTPAMATNDAQAPATPESGVGSVQ
jgi:hypothetical protein